MRWLSGLHWSAAESVSVHVPAVQCAVPQAVLVLEAPVLVKVPAVQSVVHWVSGLVHVPAAAPAAESVPSSF